MNYLTNYYKNLSEQLQARVNHLQQILNEAYPGGMTPGRREVINRADTGDSRERALKVRALRARARAADERGAAKERDLPFVALGQQHGPETVHNAIVDEIIAQHASRYPHKRVNPGQQTGNVEASAAHIREILGSHAEAPFVSPHRAVEVIAPYAIEGNYDLERAGFENALERSMGGDPTEHDWYDAHVMNNENEYAADLGYSVAEGLPGRLNPKPSAAQAKAEAVRQYPPNARRI